MAPYRALALPAPHLDELERILRFGLETHPAAQQLLRQLMDDPVLNHSDSINTTGLQESVKKGQGA